MRPTTSAILATPAPAAAAWKLAATAPPSRYHRMYDLIDGPNGPKQVFMLTATPVNNRLLDLQHMIELFSRRQPDKFKDLGIHSLPGHVRKMEKELIKATDAGRRRRHGSEPCRTGRRSSRRRALPRLGGAAQPRLCPPEPARAGQDHRRLPRARGTPSRRVFGQEDLRPASGYSRTSVRQEEPAISRWQCTIRSPTTRAIRAKWTSSSRAGKSRSSA